jgi:phosphoribosyl-ATP pyrophosphohydrolase/phosphoribosyl-AMP cyclohydrolase
MTPADVERLDWQKSGGLLPAVAQDLRDGRVLMVGFVNREALLATLHRRRATFWSRTRQCLWTKGESSGNHLELRNVAIDCDADTVLMQVVPAGPVCHTGTPTCFPAAAPSDCESIAFLATLEDIIAERMATQPEGSYTARLFSQGTTRIAQKVGEEGIEVALAAATADTPKVVAESADLLYHLLLLLKNQNLRLADVVRELAARHADRTGR